MALVPPATRSGRVRAQPIPALEIREVDPVAVADDAVRIWKESLHVEGAPERKIPFFYRESPFGPASMFALVGSGTGEIVGVAGIGTRRFHVGGAAIDAGLLVDLAVDRKHRTLLPACRLVAHVRDRARERFAFAYGLPNASAEGVFVREGYAPIARMTRWVRPLRFAPLVARFVPSDALASAAGALLDAAEGVRRSPARRAASHAGRLVWAGAFDARFDELFDRAVPAYPIVAARTSAFLAWRFFASPSPAPRIATLVRDGELRAYAVVGETPAARTAALLDVFGHSSDLGALLELLAESLRDEGFASMSFRFLGDGPLVGILRDHGFVARESMRAVVGVRGLGDASRIPFEDLARWHFTDADEDL